VRYLLDTGIDALIVHGRTTKQLSKVPADWEEIVKAVKVRDRMGVGTLIIGNGDIRSNIEANARIKESGADGVMIGRGVFEDPMVFAGTTNFSKIRVKEKLQYYLDHIRLFRETYGDKRYFAELRKFAKVYIQGYRGAKNLRTRVMRCKSMTQMELELQNAIHREDT
jgi:tRNA-dihydrouridine synthase